MVRYCLYQTFARKHGIETWVSDMAWVSSSQLAPRTIEPAKICAAALRLVTHATHSISVVLYG